MGNSSEREKILENLREIKKDSHKGKNSNPRKKARKKYKVIYERDLCIGAAACIMASQKYWELDDEGKAILKGSQETSPGVFELEITEEDYTEMFEAAKNCPVICIHIIDLQSGEKII